jgi:hypothetical protein
MVIEKRPKHKKKAQAAAKLGSFYTTPCHLIKKSKRVAEKKAYQMKNEDFFLSKVCVLPRRKKAPVIRISTHKI